MADKRKNLTPLIEALTGLSDVTTDEGIAEVIVKLESLKSGDQDDLATEAPPKK